MANALEFESPITKRYPSGGSRDLALSDESSQTKTLVRAADDSAAASQLGVAFGGSRHQAGVHIIGQRPTEWLLVGDESAAAAMVVGLDRTGHVSVIDHTHARALLRLTGERSADVLSKICNVDFGDHMTPDGSALSASVAKVGCDITRDDASGIRSYRIACDRSFAQYLFDAILDAGREFSLTAVGA